MTRYLTLFFLFFCLACSKNETETLSKIGAEYYPLTIGKSITYQIDSIIYDTLAQNVKIDTYRLQAKEVLKDTFRNLLGQLMYRMERFERKNDSDTWDIKNVFSAQLTDNQAIRLENNMIFLKFPIPVFEKQTWDGNVFIDAGLKILVAGETIEPFSKKWTFSTESLGKSEAIGNKNFTEVLTVKAQTDPKVLTEWRYQLEKYAKGIGLVYREVKILDTQRLDANIAWEKKASKGYILRMTVLSYE
ncbi:MAG: hypothetical protein RLZZ628_4112 [Bacteroidota bacterium]|jgi:hypothetical protein